MKQITSISTLNRVMAASIVACAEPDGTFRFLTTNHDITGDLDTDHLRSQSGFNSRTDEIAFDMIESKPVIFRPNTYQGVIYDLGVHQPEEVSDRSEPFLTNMASPVYARRTQDRGSVLSIVGGSYPFVVSLKGLDGEPKVYQLNGYGMDPTGVTRVQPNPEYSEEESTRQMMGQLLLSKEKGAVFISAAQQAGLLSDSKPIIIDTANNAVAVKAIQHVHRAIGVIGYTFQ